MSNNKVELMVCPYGHKVAASCTTDCHIQACIHALKERLRVLEPTVKESQMVQRSPVFLNIGSFVEQIALAKDMRAFGVKTQNSLREFAEYIQVRRCLSSLIASHCCTAFQYLALSRSMLPGDKAGEDDVRHGMDCGCWPCHCGEWS